jgi:hypothetical protein
MSTQVLALLLVQQRRKEACLSATTTDHGTWPRYLVRYLEPYYN